jgi:hypothetical protein
MENKECLMLKDSNGNLLSPFCVVKFYQFDTFGVVTRLFDDGTVEVALAGRARRIFLAVHVARVL